MDQKISLKIAGRAYNLTVSTPEMEQLYRRAADNINNRFAKYTKEHPGKNIQDLLSMVALSETVLRLGIQKELETSKSDELQLEQDLARYLKETGK